MLESLKIVIPMAGWGTRMRPHTWSKPKPLVSVAGKPALEHVLETFVSLPTTAAVEYVFIVGPFLGEQQIPAYLTSSHPGLHTHCVVQSDMKGQSHAVWLAREHLRGPVLICFADTLMETDFSFLEAETADVVAWVMPVADPRRFGVAEVAQDGWVRRFVEKPSSMDNNLAVVGCYFFHSGKALLDAIEAQMERGVALRNEYFLTDAISLMIEGGARVRTQQVSSWLDTGTIEATLETNRLLLERLGLPASARPTVETIGPVAIHPTAEISHSTIGPHASIGPNCRITNSHIADSILEADCEVSDISLRRSLIGSRATIRGHDDGKLVSLNVGDDSQVALSPESR